MHVCLSQNMTVSLVCGLTSFLSLNMYLSTCIFFFGHACMQENGDTMGKNVQVATYMYKRLDIIREKFPKCSYTQAIEYLIQNNDSPRAYFIQRWNEAKVMIRSEYSEDKEIMACISEMEKSKAELLRLITTEERKNIKELYGLAGDDTDGLYGVNE